MNYILKDLSEPERLNEQSEAREFSLESELSSLYIEKKMKILDAGCGSGVLCRYLEERYPDVSIKGCDISAASLNHCREHRLTTRSAFLEHNFVSDALPEKFDLIISRLVFHHLSLSQQKSAVKNLSCSLNSQGVLCLIDLDGLFLNLGTTDEILLSQMEKARKHFGGNLLSARYFPAMMKESGMKDISWRIETLDFQGEARIREVDQWKKRFESSLSFYLDVFGSEFHARKFLRSYLEEASKPEVPLFYNKFIVTGRV